LLGCDKEGILYIGKASSFLDRVIGLKKSLSPEYISSEHECGYRYKNHSVVFTQFPYLSLHVALIACENPRESEKEYIQKYYDSFGELPPFNRSG
jgi:hypothetical protein